MRAEVSLLHGFYRLRSHSRVLSVASLVCLLPMRNSLPNLLPAMEKQVRFSAETNRVQKRTCFCQKLIIPWKVTVQR